jgi:hypothetical protein
MLTLRSSDSDFKRTADITILPPINVQNVGTSLTKIHTHIGPSVNSKSIKRVNSAANRCFEAMINNVFTVADKRPPRTKQRSKSLQEISKLSQRKIKATNTIIKFDKIKVGSISVLRFRRIIMA